MLDIHHQYSDFKAISSIFIVNAPSDRSNAQLALQVSILSKPQQQAAGNPSKGEKGIVHAASAFLSWTKNPLFLSNGSSDMQRTIPVMHCDNPLFTDDIVCQEDNSLLDSPLGGPAVLSPSTPEGSSGLHKLTRCNSLNFMCIPPADDILEAAAGWMRHVSQSCPGSYPGQDPCPSVPCMSPKPTILQKAASSISVTAGRTNDWDQELGLFHEDEGELCGWLWDILPECSQNILTEEEERWARGLGLIAADLQEFKKEQELQWLWEVLPECLDVLTEEEEQWARELGLLVGALDLL